MTNCFELNNFKGDFLVKQIRSLFLSSLIFLSFSSFAEFKIKLDFKHPSAESKITEEYFTQYNKDLTVVDSENQRKYVLRITPVKALKVNGQDIKPIQFDIKVYGEDKKLLNRPQTVTSFYRPEANFNIAFKKDEGNEEVGLKVTILE